MAKKVNRDNNILGFFKELLHWIYYVLRINLAVQEMLETKRNKIKELPRRHGEVAVVTGASRGFGFEVIKQLLQSGFRVFVGDIESGEKALSEIKALGLPYENVEFLPLNLKSFKSVRTFAATVLNNTPSIDLLINNAGIMYPPFELTEDGFESQFQVNYLSHFLLTNLLLPKIKETAAKKDTDCRIVHTASIAARFGTLDPKQIGKREAIYASNKAYNESKLAQVLHAKYLDMKLSEENARVRVFSLHPGIVPTTLWCNAWTPAKMLVHSLRPYFRTVEDGANGIIYTALSPDLEGKGGLYLDNCNAVEPNPQTKDLFLQNLLWDQSIQFTSS